MKQGMIKLIVESYSNGIIDNQDATAYIDFIRESNLDNEDDVDVLTEMVEVLQEASVRPVSNDNRLNYWNQMIDATKNKITQKMREKSTERDNNRQRALDDEIAKLKANITNYQKNIDQIKETQSGQKPKGIGLRGTVHSTRFVGASAEFEPNELSGLAALESKLERFKRESLSDKVIDGVSAALLVNSAKNVIKNSNIPDDVRSYKSRKRNLNTEFKDTKELKERKTKLKNEIKDLKKSLNTANYDNDEADKIKRKIYKLEIELDRINPEKKLLTNMKNDVITDGLNATARATSIAFGNKIAKMAVSDAKDLIRKKRQ